MASQFNQEMMFARDIAREAGNLVLEFQRKGLNVSRKDDGTPVTDADLAAEKLLRKRIGEVFPDDGILGEEFGEGEQKRRTWVIDPIDGTKSFARNIPMYAVLVGLEVEGEVRVGALHMPSLQETLYAAIGDGCYCNDTICRVSEVSNLRDALVLTTDPKAIENYRREAGWNRLTTKAGMVRSWGDAFGYALVATGRAEVMVDPVVAPWDIAALIPIMKEAGGVITGWDGEGGLRTPNVVATNSRLSESVRELLRDPA